jgi:hypothetical protein
MQQAHLVCQTLMLLLQGSNLRTVQGGESMLVCRLPSLCGNDTRAPAALLLGVWSGLYLLQLAVKSRFKERQLLDVMVTRHDTTAFKTL